MSDNPYMAAMREWDERFAFHARQAKISTYIAVGLVALNMALAGAMVWQSMTRTYIPYVVAVDDLGTARLAHQPQMVTQWPEAVVLREISDIVRWLRFIPGDSVILDDAWRKLVLFTVPGAAAYQKMAERAQSPGSSPFALQGQITVEVQVRSVLLQGGRTWIAEWTETTRDQQSGRVLSAERYQGSFQLGQQANLSTEILTTNPLGLLLEDFDIRKLGDE